MPSYSPSPAVLAGAAAEMSLVSLKLGVPPEETFGQAALVQVPGDEVCWLGFD